MADKKTFKERVKDIAIQEQFSIKKFLQKTHI